jgi:polyisoprenoid-binding protein YceI
MKKLFLLVVAMLATSSLALAADTYTIDGAHSSANFAVKHMGISTVHGRFTDVGGSILFNAQAPEKSSVTAVIKATSVNTDNATRDKHLNTPDFFDTAKFPEIRFQSTSVRHVNGDQYVATGNLTIRDVTKTVELPFTLAQGKGPKGEPRLGAEASLTINRFDYKVSYDPTGMAVSKDIKIDLSVEASKDMPAQAAK